MVLDIWKNIKKHQFAPLYLIYGEEDYLLSETERLIRENALTEDDAEFNCAVVDLEETPIEDAIEEMETLPFLGERRVVFLKSPSFLTAEKKKEKINHDLKRLEEYINNPAPFTIAVFVCKYPKLDERKKITKELKRNAVVLEAKPLYESELEKWLFDIASSKGLTITKEAMETLISLTGNHLMLAVSELDKLALFAGENGNIDQQMVENLVSKSLDHNVFTLVDLIIKKQKAEAIRHYHELLLQKEEPIRILAAIARQYRIILQVKKLSEQGYSQSQIASKIKVNPYAVKLANQKINSFSDQQLMHALHDLATIDYQMKTGVGDKDILMELFIMKI